MITNINPNALKDRHETNARIIADGLFESVEKEKLFWTSRAVISNFDALPKMKVYSDAYESVWVDYHTRIASGSKNTDYSNHVIAEDDKSSFLEIRLEMESR